MKYILIILVLFSCTSAPKHLAKAIEKDKPYVAEQTRLLFPCVPTATATDSSAYKQYLADLKALEDFYATVEQPVATITETGDTAELMALRTQNGELKNSLSKKDNYISDLRKQCKDKPPLRDTIKVEDSAKIFSMQNHIEKINKQYEKQLADSSEVIKKRDAEIVKKDEKINSQKKAIRILLIPWILAVLYVVYRIVIKRK